MAGARGGCRQPEGRGKTELAKPEHTQQRQQQRQSERNERLQRGDDAYAPGLQQLGPRADAREATSGCGIKGTDSC